MIFTKVKHLVSKHIHTLLFLLGVFLSLLGIGYLFNFKWSLLVLGLVLVVIALIINKNSEGR